MRLSCSKVKYWSSNIIHSSRCLRFKRFMSGNMEMGTITTRPSVRTCKNLINKMIQLIPVVVNGLQNQLFFRCVKFRPRNLYPLFPVFLNPYFCNCFASMQLFAASTYHMHMTTVLVFISRKNRKNKLSMNANFPIGRIILWQSYIKIMKYNSNG